MRKLYRHQVIYIRYVQPYNIRLYPTVDYIPSYPHHIPLYPTIFHPIFRTISIPGYPKDIRQRGGLRAVGDRTSNSNQHLVAM